MHKQSFLNLLRQKGRRVTKVYSSKKKKNKKKIQEICPVRRPFVKVDQVLVTKRNRGKTSLKCRRIFRSTERSFISAVATFDFET